MLPKICISYVTGAAVCLSTGWPARASGWVLYLDRERHSSVRIILDSCPAGLALMCKTEHWREGVTPGGLVLNLHFQSRCTLLSSLSETINPSGKEHVAFSCLEFLTAITLIPFDLINDSLFHTCHAYVLYLTQKHLTNKL